MNVAAQQKKTYTINGYVSDATTGEKLIGANVYETKDLKGIATNKFGFFSLTLAEGDHQIAFSYIGFEEKRIFISLKQDTSISISLTPNAQLEEVIIEGNAVKNVAKEVQMSKINVPVNILQNSPTILGEPDVLKVVQLLPGVQSGGEGFSGLYVRGGSPDQNLMLLDGVPVYNVSHLFGFFSVFNPDAVRNVELTKGGYPARFGGRLSSVLEVDLKEGNMKEFKGSFSVGLISSRFLLEGPIKTDRTSFMISARRTYIDLLLKPFIKAQNDDKGKYDGGYFFHDINAKINHTVSKNSRWYLSVYTGKDKANSYSKEKHLAWDTDALEGISEYKAKFGWGNITGSLRWNYVWNPKLFSNLTFTFSDYKYNLNYRDSFWNYEEMVDGEPSFIKYSMDNYSGIRDYSAKMDFEYLPNPNNHFRWGASSTHHTFTPQTTQTKDLDEDGSTNNDKLDGAGVQYSIENSVYAENELNLTSKISTNIGLHYSNFFSDNEFYQSFQPRFNIRYLMSEHVSIKASATYMQQYLHFLTNSSLNLPIDIWTPSTSRVKPQKAFQAALGVAYQINPVYALNIDGYYKEMHNLITYKEGASFLGNNEAWDEKVESDGLGKSYGIEIFLQKKSGKSTGWIGYTLAWSDRHFSNINEGKTFPFKYDRRHDISVVYNYEIKEGVRFNMNWVFSTGNAMTIATHTFGAFTYRSNIKENYRYNNYPFLDEGFDYGDGYVNYPKRNQYRMPSYHRLDLGVSFTKAKKRGVRTWNVGFYNAYNRANPFLVVSEGRRKATIISLFPIVPSFSYTFKF